jgi:hypothetical protein
MTEQRIQPAAYIKHQLPGRVRLKIPQKKGDFGYFESLGESFANCHGVTQLHLNPPSASLLICHTEESDFSEIVEFAEKLGWFTICPEPEVNPIPPIHRPLTAITFAGMKRADESLRQFTQGRLNGRSFLFLGLLGLAAHQINRGHIMSPASTLLWYALSLLKEENRKSPDHNGLDDFEVD